MNEIDQLEQELTTLRQRFTQAVSLLEDLGQMKHQFQDLSARHQQLQTTLDQLKHTASANNGNALEPRLSQLESQGDVRYEQLQAQLTNFRVDFESITRQLRDTLEQQQAQLTQFQQDSEQALSGLDDPKQVKWMASSLEHLNNTVHSDRVFLQKLDRRLSQLKRVVDIIAVVGFVCFMVTGLILLVTK